MENRRFQLVSTFVNRIWMRSCPVEVREGALIYDNMIRVNCLQLSLANTTQRRLLSATVDVFCYDQDDRLLSEEPVSYLYQDMPMEKGSTFGEDDTFYLRSGSVARVECYVSKVVYLDGNVWRSREAIRVDGQPYEELSEAQRAEFEAQLAASAYQSLNCPLEVVPKRESAYWLCACGRANENEQEHCARCGMNREWLLRCLDPKRLQTALDAREEAKRPPVPAPQEIAPVPPAPPAEPQPAPAPPILPVDDEPVTVMRREPFEQSAAPVAPAAPPQPAPAPEPLSDVDADEEDPFGPNKPRRARGGVMDRLILGVLLLALAGAIVYIVWLFINSGVS